MAVETTNEMVELATRGSAGTADGSADLADEGGAAMAADGLCANDLVDEGAAETDDGRCATHFTLRRLAWAIFALGAVFIAAAFVTLGAETTRRAKHDPPGPGDVDAVYGGDRAPKKYPWAVRFNGDSCCGGSLIAKDVVLTAAHCVDTRTDDQDDEMKPGFDDLLVGAWDLRTWNRPQWMTGLDWTPEEHEIKAITIHPKYDAADASDAHDVALVYLKRNSKLKPVKLATEPPDIGTDVKLLGWECTDNILKQGDLEVRPSDACDGFDADLELCVGREDAKYHACGGDSGGPYFTKNDGEARLVGVVNRGPSCPDEWDIAASVAAPPIRAWIEDGAADMWAFCPSGEWIRSNAESAGEIRVGRATSPADCVQLVNKMCPSATSAQLPASGTGSCYCHFTDLAENVGSDWRVCRLPRPTAFPTTARPTDRPLPPPTAQPTRATSQPTMQTPQPTARPLVTTVEPTAWACRDSDAWRKANDDSKDCQWVGAKPETRCLVKSAEKVFAAEACPQSCGGCDVTTCQDDPLWRKAGESDPEKRGCRWVSRFSNRLATLGEDGRYGYQACPRAARTCRVDPPAACEDDATWNKGDDAAKTCQWVSKQPGTRCLVKDTFKVLAAEACRASCGACGMEVHQACVDSPTWHKEGNASKTCVWASRFANRLAVLGEDGTYAYASCRLAARVCDGL